MVAWSAVAVETGRGVAVAGSLVVEVVGEGMVVVVGRSGSPGRDGVIG